MTSAVIAALVPGIFDAPVAQAQTVTAPASDLVHVVKQVDAVGQTVAGLKQHGTFAIVAAVAVVERPRATMAVPPGCDRMVSPLARSAASRLISRCVT